MVVLSYYSGNKNLMVSAWNKIGTVYYYNYYYMITFIIQIQNYGIGGQYEPHCDHARVSETLSQYRMILIAVYSI